MLDCTNHNQTAGIMETDGFKYEGQTLITLDLIYSKKNEDLTSNCRVRRRIL